MNQGLSQVLPGECSLTHMELVDKQGWKLAASEVI